MLKALFRNALTFIGKIKKKAFMTTQLCSSLKTYIWREKTEESEKRKTFKAKLDFQYWCHGKKHFIAHMYAGFTNTNGSVGAPVPITHTSV